MLTIKATMILSDTHNKIYSLDYSRTTGSWENFVPPTIASELNALVWKAMSDRYNFVECNSIEEFQKRLKPSELDAFRCYNPVLVEVNLTLDVNIQVLDVGTPYIEEEDKSEETGLSLTERIEKIFQTKANLEALCLTK